MSTVQFVGTASRDSVFLTREPLRADQKLHATSSRVDIGGPAVNAARTFARLGGRGSLWTGKKGIETMLTGLGLAVEGDPDYGYRESAVIVTEGGQRQIVSSAPPPPRTTLRMPACAFALACSDLDFSQWVVGDSAETLVIDSGTSGAAILSHPILERASIVIAGHGGFADDVERRAMLRALESRSITGYCSRGPAAILSQNGEIPVPVVDAIDTSAAGDVLHGAFMYFLTRGADPDDAIRAAAEVASTSTTHLGVTPD